MLSTTERFMKLFRGYELRHGQYTIEREQASGKLSGRAATIDKAPSLQDYQDHVEGGKGIGIIPLTNSNTAYFACIDVDDYQMDVNDLVWRVRKLPLFVTRSKSGGAHLWLFIPEGAPASLAVGVIKHWAGELGLGACEIFPKQTSRINKDDIGNWINLPFFADTRLGVVVANEEKHEFKTLTLVEFLDFTDKYIASVNVDYLENKAPKVATRAEKGSKKDFVDGPPCLQRLLAEGVPEGGRNKFFFGCGTYLKRKYGSEDAVESKSISLNESLGENKLPLGEVKATLKSSLRKEYGYQCQQEPMKSFCQRSECLKRTFGIGSRSLDMPFEIGGFSKILTNPPMYAFNVDGVRLLIASSHELLNQKRFRAHIVDACSKIMPILQQQKFDELMQDWLDHAEDVVPPQDADARTQIIDALREFIESRAHSQKERIVKGHAYIDEEAGLALFRINDFKRYLRQNHVVYDDRELHQYLRKEMNVQYDEAGTSIKGKSVRLWSMPLDQLLSQEVDAPVVPKEVF